MVIVVDLTSLSYHMTGMERYAACVTEEILRIDKENQYILIFRNKIFSTFESYVDEKRVKSLVLFGNNKLVFIQWTLLKALNKIRADRYLFFAFTSPILFNKRGIFNTIHDMGAWDSAESMTLFQKLYWKISYRVAAKISQGIITVSEFSKKRISDILHLPQNKIKVAPSAVYSRVIDLTYTDSSKVKEKYNLQRQYIMALSTLEPRKNLEILLDAYVSVMDRVPYDLVLVGRKGWKMQEVLEKYNAQTRIHFTGFVSDEEVGHIYKNAICFVFPSRYEGFGLPPLEALSIGTPVIAANSASIPEVMRNQAVYFKNNSTSDLKQLLLDLEDSVESMPHELDDYQKKNYRFDESAMKVLSFIERKNNS